MATLLEALYAVEQPRAVWLRGLLQAVYRELDQGAGVGVVLYKVSGRHRVMVEAIAGIGVHEMWAREGLELLTAPRFSRGLVEFFGSVRCGTLGALFSEPTALSAVLARFRVYGLKDALVINGSDESGHGCALFVFLARNVKVSSSFFDVHERLAPHVLSGYRLQRSVEISALRALKRQLGQHLLSQEASIESRLHGGKKYRVATRSWMCPDSPRQLSRREAQIAALAKRGRSNKVIAFELGLADSTVRVLRARGASKVQTTAPRNEIVWELLRRR